MLIRRIGARDWPAIAALEARTYGALGLSEDPAALESRGRASPDTSFVLDAGGRVAGYLLALPYPEDQGPELAYAETRSFRSANLHLHDLVVDPGFRGGGLARRLLDRLGAAARPAGYHRISLIAVGGSAPFWRANGYTAHPGTVLPPGYGDGAIYMSTTLRKAEVHVP